MECPTKIYENGEKCMREQEKASIKGKLDWELPGNQCNHKVPILIKPYIP